MTHNKPVLSPAAGTAHSVVRPKLRRYGAFLDCQYPGFRE